MKIRFLKSPELGRLCLMSRSQDAGRPCFLFDPQEFRGLWGRPTFSFVYRLKDDRMAVGIPDLSHRKIAEAVFGEPVFPSQAIGAMLTYEENNGMASFKLTGHSGYYGVPTHEQFELAAQHIASQLKSPITIRSQNTIIVQTRLA